MKLWPKFLTENSKIQQRRCKTYQIFCKYLQMISDCTFVLRMEANYFVKQFSDLNNIRFQIIATSSRNKKHKHMEPLIMKHQKIILNHHSVFIKSKGISSSPQLASDCQR